MAKNSYNQWDIKFAREYPFIPFGSLVKAYGEINQGKEINIKEFIENTEELFGLAQKLVMKSLGEGKKLEKSEDEEGVDFPTK